MPDTKSTAPNGEHVASTYRQTTGGEIASQPAQILYVPHHGGTGREIKSQEYIDPSRLYEVFSPATGKFEADAPVAVISATFLESAQRLRSAIAEANELEKQNHISLAWSNLVGLARFIGVWSAFDEAVSLLFTAFETHRASPYTGPELIALQKVLEMLRRNPFPTDDDISVIYESLDAVHFDLNAPLSGVDLDEQSEEL